MNVSDVHNNIVVATFDKVVGNLTVGLVLGFEQLSSIDTSMRLETFFSSFNRFKPMECHSPGLKINNVDPPLKFNGLGPGTQSSIEK